MLTRTSLKRPSESHEEAEGGPFKHPSMPRISSTRSLSIDMKSPPRQKQRLTRVSHGYEALFQFVEEHSKKQRGVVSSLFDGLLNCNRVGVEFRTVDSVHPHDEPICGVVNAVCDSPPDGCARSRVSSVAAVKDERKRRARSLRGAERGDLAGVITPSMVRYSRAEAVAQHVAHSLIQRSVEVPQVLLGWQVLIMSSDTKYLGAMVVTAMRKNWTRQIEYQLSAPDLPDIWVVLRRSAAQAGAVKFMPVRQVLEFP